MSIAQRSINVLRRYANTKGQDQIAAGVFETTANEIERMIDRIAELEAQLEAARKDVEKLRALYRAMREPMAMIGMDKHIGPFSDEAIALLDAMNALDGGTYSKSEGS